MKSKLSDQKIKIKEGEVPMPMYTCIHVKKNVSAKIFQVLSIVKLNSLRGVQIKQPSYTKIFCEY